MKIAVTGASGFIAKNLLVHLQYRGQDVTRIERGDDTSVIEQKLRDADVVFHLAGVNRPERAEDFDTSNVKLTETVVNIMEASGRPYQLVFTSSTQAELENPYGVSKKKSEEAITAALKKGSASIYRLPGVFGKWCKPNYNSVVATFCYNIARDLPIVISDATREIDLVYVDDVVASFLTHFNATPVPGVQRLHVDPVFRVSLGVLSEKIRSFRESRTDLGLPAIGDRLTKNLYATWLSYLPDNDFSYPLELKSDNRGWLFEFIKTRDLGQVFFSKTLPGVTRGNHFHHTKVEKFLVFKGEGLIRFRHLLHGDVIEYPVSGEKPRVVDIPPGYTHSITNTGTDEMFTLFWANEIFDPGRPDTFAEKV